MRLRSAKTREEAINFPALEPNLSPEESIQIGDVNYESMYPGQLLPERDSYAALGGAYGKNLTKDFFVVVEGDFIKTYIFTQYLFFGYLALVYIAYRLRNRVRSPST